MLEMKKEDICFMSACDMLEKIKSQELTSQEITEAIIERIEKINPLINAYCTPTFELARETAKKADEMIKGGEKLGFLQGLPISIKDETETKGIRTTMGSRLFENNVPRNDAVIVRRLRDAGIVILGKTNTPSFGYKGETDNLIFGVTKNPWNLERTPGGSSGGAASAVASGLGPVGIGSDGGGSIRIPSCFCGVYGLKSTFGRVPQSGMKLMGYLGTFVHRGPLVRYVRDAALILDVIAGQDDVDRYSVPKPNYSYLELLDERPKSLKIGYSLDLGFAEALDPEVEKSVLNGIQKFEEFNWSTEKSRIKLRNPESIFSTIWSSGFAYALGPYLEAMRDKMDPGLAAMVEFGYTYSTKDIKIAEVQREMVHEEICKVFKKVDVLITPTLACPAFELGKSQIIDEETMKTGIIIDGKNVSSAGWLPFTYPFNASGHPAASIPCGWSSDGLPIGMQIVGKTFDELTVLQVSKAFEDIAPWQDKKPKFN
ncbi:MAG: amidase [Promethearchaeota archaeon]|jgi:Asp-tRNA(Asn)/Glu-tRNA(Gln) amidotransferase A subunit family amidase